jgi:hypothetical protein
MKAAVLTIASVKQFDAYEDALYVLDDQQEAAVRAEVQERQLSGNGILIIIEGYASLQGVGNHHILFSYVIPTRTSGINPNTEWLNREVIYHQSAEADCVRYNHRR